MAESNSIPLVPTALIVCGPPCAGKSTAARRLRNSLRWPLLAKDAFKESMFDSLGWSDRAWSKRVSAASYTMMFAMARELLVAEQSCILEGNFRWPHNEAAFRELTALRSVRFAQLLCTAQPDILIARWRARVTRDERHPGHVDHESSEEIEAELREHRPEPLPFGEPALVFDSSSGDFAALDELVASVIRRTRD